MADQAKEVKARKRIPLGARNVLKAAKRPGYVRRFVNDQADNIQMFKDAGYTVVKDDSLSSGDDKLGRPGHLGSMVNPHVGSGTRAVLMEIPEEFYLADQAEKQAKIKLVEDEMKREKTKTYADGLSGSVNIS